MSQSKYHLESMEQFEGLNLMQIQASQLPRASMIGEENLLKDALREHLNRESTEEDWKECNMAFQEGNPDEYQFSYKGKYMGMVVREFEIVYRDDDFMKNLHTLRRTVRFYPAQKELEERK